jgi:hypothetical protein
MLDESCDHITNTQLTYIPNLVREQFVVTQLTNSDMFQVVLPQVMLMAEMQH